MKTTDKNKFFIVIANVNESLITIIPNGKCNNGIQFKSYKGLKSAERKIDLLVPVNRKKDIHLIANLLYECLNSSSLICIDLQDFKEFFDVDNKTNYIFEVGIVTTKSKDLSAFSKTLIDLQKKSVNLIGTEKLWLHIRTYQDIDFDLINSYITIIQSLTNKGSSMLYTAALTKEKIPTQVFLITYKELRSLC